MSDDFSPLETMKQQPRAWWFLSALMLLGALGGLIFSMLRPPLYESTATFALGIDYSRTGPLTQYDEDQILGMAGGLIYSAAAADQVVAYAQSKGLNIDRAFLYENAFIERKSHVWTLRLQHPDPQTSVDLTRFWAETGWQLLKDSYSHALKKESLERAALSLESCLAQSALAEPLTAGCATGDLPELQSELDALHEQILTEKEAARNIFPGLVFEEVRVVEDQPEPALYGRGSLVLAGWFIGAIIGLWGVFSGIPARLFRQEKRS